MVSLSHLMTFHRNTLSVNRTSFRHPTLLKSLPVRQCHQCWGQITCYCPLLAPLHVSMTQPTITTSTCWKLWFSYHLRPRFIRSVSEPFSPFIDFFAAQASCTPMECSSGSDSDSVKSPAKRKKHEITCPHKDRKHYAKVLLWVSKLIEYV